MRRIAVAIVIVGGILSGAPGLHAAGRPVAQRLLDGLKAPRVMHAVDLPSVTHERKLAPRSRSHQDQASTALPDSAWSPAQLDSQFVGTEDDATADGNFFAAWHSQTYEQLQRSGGYYERAHLNFGSDVVYFRYQSSIFANAAVAQNAWNDTKTFSSNHQVTVQDCASSVNGLPCTALGYISTSNHEIIGFSIQVNQCLAETSTDAPSQDVYNANSSQINNILASVTASAIQVLSSVCSGNSPPKPTPTSTKPSSTTIDFQLISVRIEKNGAGADWNQVRPSLAQVKKGGKVQFSLYVIVNSAPPSEPFSMHWTATEKGRTVFTDTFNDKLDASQPAQTYRIYVKDVTMKTPGKVQVTGRLTMGGQAEQGNASFTVLKPHQKSATPPPPAHFSFSFNSLSVTENGKAGRSFAAGSPIVIVAAYTARNVPAGRPVTGQMKLTYQQSQNGQFRPFNTGHESFLVSKNGIHRQGHPTSFGAPGTVRIVVGLTIGGIFHQKSIDITLR